MPILTRTRRSTRLFRAVVAAAAVCVLGSPILAAQATASGAPAAPAASTATAATVPAASAVAPAAVGFGTPRDIAVDVGVQNPNYRFSSIAILRGFDANGIPSAPYAEVAGLPDGTITVYRLSDGANLWRAKVGNDIQASPAITYVQGRAFIAVGSLDGWVQVFDQNGQTLFRQQLPPGPGGLRGVFGTPAVADITGDGILDLVATSYNQNVYAWNLGTGALLPGFPVWVKDTIWSSPTIAHLDGDPLPEIVFGFDCDGASTQWCYPNYGGYIGALTHVGGWRGGFPVFVPRQTVWSTPAVADLEGNGRSDIVVGTGDYRDSRSWGSSLVYAVRGDGSPVPGWPAQAGTNTFSSPAVGALGTDGGLGVAIVSTDGYLHVYDRGGRQSWSRCVAACGNTGSINSSPTIADLDGDGRQEVLVATNGTLYAFSGDGTQLLGSVSMATQDPLTAAPTVASVGGRTHVYIMGATRAGTTTAHLYDFTLGSNLGRADWPGFKQSSSRLGVLGDHVWPSTGRSYGSSVRAGTILQPGDYLQTGSYRAVMQGDGNFVVYGRSVWSSGTNLSASFFAVQGDGNLVVYSQSGQPRWNSGTFTPPDQLVMQGDGNLVLYAGGRASWQSGTYR